MGTLQQKLTALKDRFEQKADPGVVAVMHQATDRLRRSGIMDRVLPCGAPAPMFTLPNTIGAMVSSKDLLKKGPLVLVFYRGVW